MDIFNRLNDEEKQIYTDLSSDEARRLFLQMFFKKDFGAFVYLLGYRDLGKFHQKEIEWLGKTRYITDQPVRRIWLWSRGFFKTSLITEAHTLWLIVNNPNSRILIVSFTLEVAKKALGAIRNHFIGNEDFRGFFREFVPKPNKEGKIEFGTTEYFTIPNRTKSLKEPTVMCAGVGTNITGLHFDWMKIDDLVNQDSVTNDTQIQASKDYYSLLRPIFDNPTCPREDVIGTIYHFNDLHCALRLNKDFEQSFRPAIENEEFTFPERLNAEGWEKLTTDPNINPYDIQRQWLLRPVDPKDAKFQADWWKTYQELPKGCVSYVLCDPASVQKKKSDYTVIQRWDVANDGKWHFVEGIRDKLTVFQRIDEIVRICKGCPKLVGMKYEVAGGRHGDLESLKLRFLQEGIPVVPDETKGSNGPKRDRIEQRLVGRFHAGMILFPLTYIYKSVFDNKTQDFVQQYRLEYLQFPYTEHDDILDCHSFGFDDPSMLMRGTAEKTKEQQKDWNKRTADEIEKEYKEIDREAKRYPHLSRSEAIQNVAINSMVRILKRKG